MYRRKTKQHSLPGPDDVYRQTLPNGITLLVRENFASSAVVVNGYVEVGEEDEALPREGLTGTIPKLHGLAGFVTDVIERGTQRRPFEQLYEEIESIGAHFGLNAGTHITSFGAKGLAEYLPLLLDIISDTLRNPAFHLDQVEKARAEILTSLKERENDTQRMASLLFRELVYPETHPYHWSLLGYPDTIANITRDDLVQFHQRYFSPQGLTLVVVGGIKVEQAVQAITEKFGDWQSTRPERAPLPGVAALAERREQHITLADKTQSNLVLGWPGPARLDDDFIPCYIGNTVLGIFGLYGRLGKSVREANGLAYYAYSQLDGGKGPGPWRIIAGVNPRNVEKATRIIQQEVRRMRDELIPEDELNDSKSFLTGSLPLQLETNEGVARSLVNIERYDLGLDYLYRYNDIIMNVTTKQIQAAVQRWMDPEHFALAVAEPPAESE